MLSIGESPNVSIWYEKKAAARHKHTRYTKPCTHKQIKSIQRTCGCISLHIQIVTGVHSRRKWNLIGIKYSKSFLMGSRWGSGAK